MRKAVAGRDPKEPLPVCVDTPDLDGILAQFIVGQTPTASAHADCTSRNDKLPETSGASLATVGIWPMSRRAGLPGRSKSPLPIQQNQKLSL